MSEKKHAPLPWRVRFGVLDAHGKPVGSGNDEFIVRACNNHYELLEVVRKVAEHFADTDAPLGAAAREAIAKAEGK